MSEDAKDAKDAKMQWIQLGLRAMKLGFDQNEQVDPTKSQEEIKQCIELFYKSIELGATDAWPFIKLADLISDDQEKIRLYKESLNVKQTMFAKSRLYDLLLASKEST